MANLKATSSFERVYELVSEIPVGKVSTYGAIAKALAIKNPRYVGFILHQNPYEGLVPCHRVVNSQGKLAQTFAFGGLNGQKERLANEGLEIVNGKVDLEKYIWKF